METLEPVVCALCVIRNICRDRRSGWAESPQGETASCRRVVVSPIQASIPQQSPVSVSAGSSTTGPVTQQMTAMTITPEVSADQSDTGKEDGDEQGEEEEAEEEDVEEEEASKDPADGVDVTQESSEGDQRLDNGRKSNRCFACRKKVGLTGFDCRCGNLFCCAHRYSDKHECPYDYRSAATTRLRKENPVVVAEKIQKL